MNFAALVLRWKISGALIGVALCLWAEPAFGQKMTFNPPCGQAGVTKVCVTGSGWAEPQPVCFYRFYFDGAQVVFPDQPDGLFGPPVRSFIVPSGAAAGEHPIKVDLRITSNNQLLQSKQSGDLFFDFTFPFFHFIPSFKVVPAVSDPFTPPPDAVTFGAGSMAMTFDPKDACIGECSAIRFIQTIKMEGHLKAFPTDPTKTRLLTFGEQGWDHAADYDKNTTADGITVDQLWNTAAPYYPFPIPMMSLIGVSNSTAQAATMGDQPARGTGPPPAGGYPSDIDKIILNFESAIFCASGALKGMYLGKINWRWEQADGQAPSVTVISFSRDQPSPQSIAAVNLWNANHGFIGNFPIFTFTLCP